MRVPVLIYGLTTLALSIFTTAINLPVDNLVKKQASNSTPSSPDENHTFTFREFEPQDEPNGSFRQPYFRFLVLFRQKPGTTEEHFHQYRKTIHADLTLSDENVGFYLQRYTQLHQDKHHRDKIQPLIAATNGALQMAPYDGIAEFYAKDYETFEKFFAIDFQRPSADGGSG